jgi:hypothetical protein
MPAVRLTDKRVIKHETTPNDVGGVEMSKDLAGAKGVVCKPGEGPRKSVSRLRLTSLPQPGSGPQTKRAS